MAPDQQNRTTNNFKNFLEDSVVDSDSHEPNGHKTHVESFRLPQAKKPDKGVWIWIFRPNMALARGRDLHETLSYRNDKFSTLLAPIRLQRDKVPVNGLFRAVEGQLRAFQL